VFNYLNLDELKDTIDVIDLKKGKENYILYKSLDENRKLYAEFKNEKRIFLNEQKLSIGRTKSRNTLLFGKT